MREGKLYNLKHFESPIHCVGDKDHTLVHPCTTHPFIPCIVNKKETTCALNVLDDAC